MNIFGHTEAELASYEATRMLAERYAKQLQEEYRNIYKIIGDPSKAVVMGEPFFKEADHAK